MFTEGRFVHSFVSSKTNSISWSDNKENVSPTLPHCPSRQALRTRANNARLCRTHTGLPLIRHSQVSPTVPSSRHIRVHHARLIKTLSTSSWPFVLPRKLPRPEFRSIDAAAIAAVDPDLVDVPLAYIRHILREIGPKLLEGAAKAKAIPPTTSELPLHLEVICGDATVEPPSHVIAAYTDKHELSQVTLFPVHGIILGTYCANLPPLSPSMPQVGAAEGQALSVPVVPIRIPSISMLPPLLSYLYTRRCDLLFPALVFNGDVEDPYNARRRHAKSEARKVHAIWSNACALGIFDDTLFTCVEKAWEECLSALSDEYSSDVEDDVDGST